MDVEVRVGGDEVFHEEIGDNTGWTTVSFEVPPGPGTTTVEVAVVAQPGIERNFSWGRHSVVLLTDVKIPD